jgi:cellulose 1,4-beta-cellobiosidase
MATSYTTHACNLSGFLKCTAGELACGDIENRTLGVCDKDGCNVNPYRVGQTSFYGPGSSYKLDTTKPFTVVT